MTAILLAYSATAYFFSGSVCYLASQNDSDDRGLKHKPSKFIRLGIALLWPIWIIKEVNAGDIQSENRTIAAKTLEYSTDECELVSTVSRVAR